MNTSTITDERGTRYASTTTHGHECSACRAAEQGALGLLRCTGSVSVSYGDTGNCVAKVERLDLTDDLAAAAEAVVDGRRCDECGASDWLADFVIRPGVVSVRCDDCGRTALRVHLDHPSPGRVAVESTR